MKLKGRNEERECNLIRSEIGVCVDLVTLKLKLTEASKAETPVNQT